MLKQCQQREDMARADAMAKSMQAKDAVSFWKNVSKTYKKGIPNATNVNGKLKHQPLMYPLYFTLATQRHRLLVGVIDTACPVYTIVIVKA